MEPSLVGMTAAAGLLLMLAGGIPVAAALGLTGIAGLWWVAGPRFAMSMAQTLPYAAVAKYAWAVLPLFVLMGGLAAVSGITMDLFRTANLWLSRVRGGLYMAVIGGSAGFAAASGSTVVNAVVFTRLALPEMIRHGYSRSLSIGCICAAGTFAAMIPPSLTMVIYAIITEQSIGRLLVAGIIPGVLSAALYAAMVAGLVRWRPRLAPVAAPQDIDWPRRLTSLRRVSAMVALVVIVMGGIYGGFFPPSGAGAAGAFGAFAIALWKRGAEKGWLRQGLVESASVTGSIFAIIVGGLFFSRFLVVGGVVDVFSDAVAGMFHTAGGVLAAFSLMYIVLGCFLDTASMMVITLPFVFPVVQTYGIDPIWFGIVFVKVIEISVITPPVGLNLYAVMGAAGKQVSFGQLVKGVLPFLLVDLITLALLVAFPAFSTWLPGLMG